MKKMLIVDDSATSRMLFKAYLPTDLELEVNEAGDTATALSLAGEILPDVVVLDMNMPDGNGIDLARDMQQQGLQALFVLLTANTQASVLEEATSAGFRTVLEKPITREKIDTIMDMILD